MERDPAEVPEQPASSGTAPRRRPRLVHVVLGLSALLGAFVLAGFSWLVMAYPRTPGPGGGETVEVEITQATSLSNLAAQLARGGVLERPYLWALYARIRGAEPHLRRGVVRVQDDMSPLALLQRLAEGYGAAEVRVVIPEGFTRFDIAERFVHWGLCERDAFLRRTMDPRLLAELDLGFESAEGFLFPDTYRLHDAMGAEPLVRRLVRTAHRRLDPLLSRHRDARRALREEFGWGVREIVTLASIVEREAATAAEQPVVAGVFLNRLRDPEFRPKRLQADPTVAYGCLLYPDLASCQGFDGRHVTRAMLADADNPYNTYRHEGLPPGPIANPGLSALSAVLAPARHEYYYFVAGRDGRHRFSTTLEEHNEAVRDYREQGH